MNKLLIVLLAGMALSACQKSGTALDAGGDTPVRNVVCDSSGANCEVHARFNTLEACEHYKRWASMICDTASNPGVMSCSNDPNAASVSSYCTK
jgi:hypothetical protein